MQKLRLTIYNNIIFKQFVKTITTEGKSLINIIFIGYSKLRLTICVDLFQIALILNIYFFYHTLMVCTTFC